MRVSPPLFLWNTLFAAALCVPPAALAQRSDYAREKRWADEIEPALVVGEAVSLRASKHKFLGLYAEAKNARGAAVIAHGAGVHPDYGLIGSLRTRLADSGYTTLSIQMPILAADAPAERYAALFPEAGTRLTAAFLFLQGKGYRRIALVSHSMGSRMANYYLAAVPNVPLSAWVAVSISSGNFEAFGPVKFPVFDVYAEKDLDVVLRGATSRARILRKMPGSKQAMVYGTDHFFSGKDKELASLIRLLLDGAAK
jgi:hypothetical protein